MEANAAPFEHMYSYDREKKIWDLGYIRHPYRMDCSYIKNPRSDQLNGMSFF